MHKQTVWAFQRPRRQGLFHRLHNTHLHSGAAIAIIAALSLSALAFTSFFTTDIQVMNDTLTFSVELKRLRAAEPTYSLKDFKGVDVMKYTKDVMRNQQSDAEINNIVSAIARHIKPTHIAISIPLDSSEAYPNAKPSPRTARAFTQTWADAIHSQGIKIIWRGTWSGIEGIYDFPKLDGADRFPAGTAASAPTDGHTTWLGKTYRYILDNPSFFSDGDIWAPMPERTEGIFQDATSFLPHTGLGIQANYVNFFNDLKTVSDSAFAQLGKNVKTGWTANNFTEVKSNWLYNSLFATAGIISIDHYGMTHMVQEMESDLRYIYKQKKKQIFLQEWGDYWNQHQPAAERLAYLQSMYSMFQKLANEGILAGFNYWGGWTGNLEGVLVKKSDGTYGINDRGALLAAFYANNPSGIAPTPTVVPPPVSPTPTPTPLPPPPPPSTVQPKDKPVKEPRGKNRTSATKTQTAGMSSEVLPYQSGDLVNDNGTIYLIMGQMRLPFTNFEAFVGLGFANRNVLTGSTTMYQTPSTYKLEKPTQQHPWGSWILHNGTVYYSTQNGLIGVSTYEIMTDNGGSFDQLVPANSSDIKAITSQVMGFNDPRVIK